MNRVDNILADYDKNLEKAKTGECKKVTQSTEFRYSFRRKYREEYETELEEIKKKLLSKNHAARVGEKSSEEVFYGFTLAIVPRHLLSSPADRYYPCSLWSTISFIANEHTRTVDVEVTVRPNIEKEKSNSIIKIPKDEFDGDLLVEKVAKFLQEVFDETIVIDFKA